MSGCPVCSSPSTIAITELNSIPVLCNALAENQASALCAPTGNLSLFACTHCGHLFNASFDPDKLTYDQTYDTALHHSKAFASFAKELAESLVDRHNLTGKHALEMGCGQGHFLQLLLNAGAAKGTGYDPAYNDEVSDPRLEIVPGLYDFDLHAPVADLACSRHVLEHLEAPNEGLELLSKSLAPDGAKAIYCEVPNALYTLEEGGIWDLIYEHVSYFTPQSLAYLAGQCGLRVDMIETSFGGQYLGLHAKLSDVATISRPHENELKLILTAAKRLDETLQTLQATWQDKIQTWARDGYTTVLWGAGSKGVTFLNIVNAAVDHVVDISPTKTGRFVPGTGHEILPPAALPDRVSGDVRILCMNPVYKSEIAEMVGALGLQAELHCP